MRNSPVVTCVQDLLVAKLNLLGQVLLAGYPFGPIALNEPRGPAYFKRRAFPVDRADRSSGHVHLKKVVLVDGHSRSHIVALP